MYRANEYCNAFNYVPELIVANCFPLRTALKLAAVLTDGGEACAEFGIVATQKLKAHRTRHCEGSLDLLMHFLGASAAECKHWRKEALHLSCAATAYGTLNISSMSVSFKPLINGQQP